MQLSIFSLFFQYFPLLFRQKTRSEHLNIYRFIQLLKEEQNENEGTIRMIDAGRTAFKKNKKYNDVDEKIKSFKENLTNGQITLKKYMDSVSHLIHLE